MAYVITNACIVGRQPSCVDDQGRIPCVEACPIDGIFGRPGDPQLYADADECIECADCFVECPVSAILMDCDAPSGWRQLNADRFHAAKA
jgi:Fe-S-cluster-containing hydrogenase component 2